MKRIFSIIRSAVRTFAPALLVIIMGAVGGEACHADIFSRVKTDSDRRAEQIVQKHTNETITSAIGAYASGIISVDSLVNLALNLKSVNPEGAERCLRPAAEAGELRAATELGVLYAFNPKFAKQKSNGIKILEAAAKAGYKEADGYLGYYYYTIKDYGKAKSYLEAARPFTLGIEYATLGGMYLEGNGVKEDGRKARENFGEAARLGLPRGMSLYASLLGTNNGGAIDYPDSFFWFYLAGELGDNYARVMLYRPRLPEEEATGEIGRDAQTALTWIEAVHTGKSMKDEPVYRDGFLKGLKAREEMAEKGDDWSRFYLGGMNYNGDFLNQNYAQALRYYDAIAKSGKLPRPMLALVHERLAAMYRDGKGTAANATQAERHLRTAASLGSPAALKMVDKSEGL